MPNNMSDFNSTLDAKLQECANELPLQVRQAYVRDMQHNIEILNTAYDVDNMGYILSAYIAYADTNKTLHSRRIEYYFKAMPEAELNHYLLQAAIQAFTIALPELSHELENFKNSMNLNVGAWRVFLLKQLAAQFIELEEVFNNTAHLISDRFIDSVNIRCGYDIYRKFEDTLRQQLMALATFIQEKIAITAITSTVVQFTCAKYQACLATESTPPHHTFNPIKYIASMEAILLSAVTARIDSFTPASCLIFMLERVAEHRAMLATITPDISNEDAYKVIKWNRNIFYSAYNYMQDDSEQQIQGFLHTWIQRDQPTFAWAIAEVRKCENNRLIRRTQAPLLAKYDTLFREVFKLPDFLVAPHERVVAAPRPS